MSESSPTPPAFPFARHSSLLGVRTTLLGFVALYLPRSSFLIAAIPEQVSSKDRPQPLFLQPLTAEPLLTVAWLCLGTFVTQIWWASLMRVMWMEKDVTKDVNDEERVRASITGETRCWGALKDAIVSTLVASTAFHIVVVLFGAPIVGYFSKTYLLGLLLASLAVYPAVYALNAPSLSERTQALVHRLEWVRLFAEFSHKSAYERAIVYPSYGAILGAWLGAIPIALDWDRPWQAWPLTPAYGALIGNVVASWVALLVDMVIFLAAAHNASISDDAAKAGVSKNSRKRQKNKQAKWWGGFMSSQLSLSLTLNI